MSDVAAAAEAHIQANLDAEARQAGSIPDAIGEAIPALCRTLPITRIVAITRSGFAARMIAAQRPRQPSLAVSDDEVAARSFNLIAGTVGVFSETPFPKSSMDHIGDVLQLLWRRGRLTDDDMVLVTGVTYPHDGSRMNTIQIHRMADLIASLKWRKQ